MPFNFALMNLEWHPAKVRSVIETVESAIAPIPNAFPNYVLGNHDDRRLASRLGFAKARAAMFLLLTLRGTPTLYYGDELDMVDGVIPPEQEQDPRGKFQPGLGHDPARTPMQWDKTANAGFCAANVQPWLPVADVFARVNVEHQRQDAQSMFKLVQRLLQLRKRHEAIAIGEYQTIYQNEQVLIFERRHKDEPFWIAINFSSEAIALKLPELNGEIELSTHLDRTQVSVSHTLELRADEGVLIKQLPILP